MARSDLLLQLVEAGARGDVVSFRRAVEAMVAEERAKNHSVLAERLARSVRTAPLPLVQRKAPDARAAGSDLWVERVPVRQLNDIFLPTTVRAAVEELVDEQHRVELLRSYGLEPRHRVLLAGPPGTGKTMLAEVLAQELAVPLLIPRYEAVIGSFLGETANRLGKVFEHARTQRCVLFLDEFDALGKERGDAQETGEIKRVVSSLLLQVDDLPSHVVVVTATNHPELLDRAVWRRFQLRLHLPMPTRESRTAWFTRAIEATQVEWGVSARTLAERLSGTSYADLAEFTDDVRRRLVLDAGAVKPAEIVKARLAQWSERYSPQGE